MHHAPPELIFQTHTGPWHATAAEPRGLFKACMDELDALQELRQRDPTQSMQAVLLRRQVLPALPAAEVALLGARCTLHIGAALVALGQHRDARRELELLQTQLAAPVLQLAAPALQQQAQRCAIAGANARAVLANAMGEFAAALRSYLQALELARAIGDQRYQAHVLVNLANTYEQSGLAAEALEHSRHALQLAQALQMHELVGDIHHNIGNALAACGEHESGLASNQRALQAYDALELPQKQRYALVAVAERLLELQRPAEAAAALAEREQRERSFVNPQYAAYAAYLSGRIANAQQRPAAARQAFASALAISEHPLDDRVGQARARLELARLDLADGRLADAAAQSDTALALLQDSAARRDLAHAHQLASVIAKAQGELAQALQHHEAFHASYERCFNDESARKAQLLAVRHEVDLARADAQRQRVENARLSEALAEIAIRLQAGKTPLTGPASAQDLQALGLTPREAEVLFWVTQGKTNEDVTAILGASLSTVKTHLRHIYEKLGVENRTAAANAARSRAGGAAPNER